MSLNAVANRGRSGLTIDVVSLVAIKDEVTVEYYFPTPEHDGKFPADLFIAKEFWNGNVAGIAELREELRKLSDGSSSILLERCLYSGTHWGDLLELELPPAPEHEILSLLGRPKAAISACLDSVLKNMLDLINAAKIEKNPIVFA